LRWPLPINPRTKAQALGLQQDDVEAFFGEIQRGRYARKPATDHTDIGVFGAHELRVLDHFLRGGDIVAGRMIFGTLHDS
jgi:hypothetical protein